MPSPVSCTRGVLDSKHIRAQTHGGPCETGVCITVLGECI